jgi:hypothetical protein
LFAQKKPINEDWLKKDRSNLINLAEVFQSEEKDIDFYINNIENLHIHDEQDLGFGAKRYEFTQFGGYLNNDISVCAFNNLIFYCKVSISSKEVRVIDSLIEADSNIFKLLSENWIKKTEMFDNWLYESFDYNYLNDSLVAEYENSVVKELGEQQDIRVDSIVLNDYHLLLYPYKKYDFGNVYCCFDFPVGEIAIRNIKEQMPALIYNICRGYCPEGRIYGVKALLEMANEDKLILTDDDIELIKKVILLDIPINKCYGCKFSVQLAKDIFNKKDYGEILKKHNITLE